MRKEASTLLVFYAAAILMLLLASPLLPLSNPLLQPAQAQTLMTFKTPEPASSPFADLTFDAHGITSTSNPTNVEITNGTIQLQAQQTYTGEVTHGSFTNDSSRASINFNAKIGNTDYTLRSGCSSLGDNTIQLSNEAGEQDFTGPVECTTGEGDSASSMTGTTTTQDRDSDGIPDSSDKCPHNSEHRCFKEGDPSTTTTSTSTNQQHQPSSSRTGNQTR